jgi:hypothetical protein
MCLKINIMERERKKLEFEVDLNKPRDSFVHTIAHPHPDVDPTFCAAPLSFCRRNGIENLVGTRGATPLSS